MACKRNIIQNCYIVTVVAIAIPIAHEQTGFLLSSSLACNIEYIDIYIYMNACLDRTFFKVLHINNSASTEKQKNKQTNHAHSYIQARFIAKEKKELNS